MSKQSKRGLTGSEKRARRASQLVNCLDGLHESFETITTLAGLLEASGKQPEPELLQPATVGHAGTLILAEMEKAGAWLEQLEAAVR